MFNFVYEFLARLGYTHPIHPTEVHMPIGLLVGALIFAYFAMERFLYRLSKSPYADDCQGNLESTRSLVGITAYPARSFNQRCNTRVLRVRQRLWNPL